MTRLALLMPVLAMGAGTLTACGPAKNPTGGDAGIPAYRGLLTDPRQLAFTCVVPGCDTTLPLKIISNVNRRVAIKRIVLSDPNPEFTLTTDEPAPFVLGAASEFTVNVRFLPVSAPRSDVLNLLVTYTDASAEESPDRIEANELKIPLVKRLVGEPILAATPRIVTFGLVPVGQRKELPVTVTNVGFGNIALAVDGADAGSITGLEVNLPTGIALVPDAGAAVPFAFKPEAELYLRGTVEIHSSTPNVDPVLVAVEGTSHTWPKVVLEPEETALEFGEIPKGQMRKVTVRLANVGGRDLSITSLSATDPSNQVTVTFPNNMTTATLAPLTRLSLDVQIRGTAPGLIDVPLKVVSNDPQRGTLDIPIHATITEPKASVSPTTLDWGTMPMGWVVAKSLELKNVGFGTLTVKRISFAGGTSNLFTLKNLPPLPITLTRDARAAFDVEFRAETAASFGGTLSIETDDPAEPFTTVTLAAVGGSCMAGCPITNGTPSCEGGTCKVGMCNTGWNDTDGLASTGCECQEIGSDPGGFCTTGVNKGILKDDGSSANHTGLISSATDEDFIIFYAQDDTQFLDEDFNVRVRLESADPSITMCVARYDSGTSVSECYPDSNKVCDTRDVRRGGSFGNEDGAMFYIKVYRKPGNAPTCTPYTVYMSNG